MKFRKEREDNNIEYKQQIINLSFSKIESYVTQLNFRLFNGKGEAIYVLGITDDGFFSEKSLDNLIKSVNNFNLICKKIKIDKKKTIIIKKKNNYFALIRINSNNSKYSNPPFLSFDYSL